MIPRHTLQNHCCCCCCCIIIMRILKMKMPQSSPRVYRAGQSFQFETRYRKLEITATRRICRIQSQRQRLWKVYGNTESITSRFLRHGLYRAGHPEIFTTCLLSLSDTQIEKYILVQQNRGFTFLSIWQKKAFFSFCPPKFNIQYIPCATCCPQNQISQKQKIPSNATLRRVANKNVAIL